ncbi:MAG: PTS sugar transporter subunit IIA [Planctomycetota bacterium]
MKPPVTLVDLRPLLDPARICFFPDPVDKRSALTQLAHVTAAAPAIGDEAAFTRAIFEREEVSPTAIGGGVAVPHAKLPSITGFVVSIGIAQHGIDYGLGEADTVNELIMIGANDRERKEYLRILAAVAALMKRSSIRDGLRQARSADEVITIVCC